MSVIEHPAQLPRLIAVVDALRAGLGVEDIAARRIAPAGFARDVVSLLRASEALERVLGVRP